MFTKTMCRNWSILAAAILLSGCAGGASYLYPDNSEQATVAAVINAYPAKTDLASLPEWDVKGQIADNAVKVFSKQSNIVLKPIIVAEETLQVIADSEGWSNYQPSMDRVYESARSSGIKTLYIVRAGKSPIKGVYASPGTDAVVQILAAIAAPTARLMTSPQTSYLTGSGLAYSFGNTISAASGIAIDSVDVGSKTLLGTMDLHYVYKRLQIENDLSDEVVEDLAVYHETVSGETVLQNEWRILGTCTSPARLSAHSEANKTRLKKGVSIAIAAVFEQVDRHFAGKDIQNFGAGYTENGAALKPEKVKWTQRRKGSCIL